jgi:hypothetical protein
MSALVTLRKRQWRLVPSKTDPTLGQNNICADFYQYQSRGLTNALIPPVTRTVIDSSAKTGEAESSVADSPLKGVAVPCAAGSFNACFEQLLCMFLLNGI